MNVRLLTGALLAGAGAAVAPRSYARRSLSGHGGGWRDFVGRRKLVITAISHKTRGVHMQPTRAGDAASAAREKFEDRGAEIIDQAKRKVGRAYDQANRGLSEQYERVIDYSRENPGTATLIAFGAGVGVGLLVAGRFNVRPRRNRLVEPVMNALSTLAYNLVR